VDPLYQPDPINLLDALGDYIKTLVEESGLKTNNLEGARVVLKGLLSATDVMI